MSVETQVQHALAPTNVHVRADSAAGATYRKRRHQPATGGGGSGTIAPGFQPKARLDMTYFGGKTIADLHFTNLYVGGTAAWQHTDIAHIDDRLAAAMTDPGLNAVLAQYYPGATVTSTWSPSRVLDGSPPATIYQDTIEGLVSQLHDSGAFASFPLDRTVFCFPLPPGTVLVDGLSTDGSRRKGVGAQADDDGGVDLRTTNVALRVHDDALDSQHGLGGYHGSVHVGGDTVYYATGVYSETTASGDNGIVAFDAPWKNIVATFYHELVEARTDPDVGDCIRAGNDPKANAFLGWYSTRDGEIGDIPMEEAGANLSLVMQEVTLADGTTAPIQLMWSNQVHGPEGPIPGTSG